MERRERRDGSSRKGRKERVDGLRGGGRRLRQGISNWIGEASSVLYSEGKLGEKSQLALLSGKLGWRKVVKGSYKRLVISEEEERTTF